MQKLFVSIGICLFMQQAYPQSSAESAMHSHVSYLADDRLEGRATGSNGEKLASEYIINQFTDIGLTPAGDNKTFLETFSAFAGKEKVAAETYLKVKDKNADTISCYPFYMSGNGRVTGEIADAGYGIVADALNYNDYKNIDVKNKVVLIRLSAPSSDDPHSRFAEFADERLKIKTAEEKGAAAVIFYNTDSLYEDPKARYVNRISAENIPVYFADKKTAGTLQNYKGEVTVSVNLQDIYKTGHNIAGYIDNGAINTIIIGAHYDHLGHGEIEGSLYRGEPAIHNGADDNASGVALIIEMARKLKTKGPRANNYLFLAFSGEEMGLLGSNAFVNSTAFKNYTINYMLNFDMVGRLDPMNRTLLVNGVGTSPSWNIVKSVDSAGLHIKTTEPGIGPSDQTSFYLKDIPVLFFFTGTHSDYHKPSDDADKINYAGMEQVLTYTYNIISGLDTAGRLSFTKTKEENKDEVPQFKVTLGVIPDYAFDGKGMRIDGVTDGKTASKAGLLAGDIVLKLGDYEVVDMMSYMKALGKFSKGDKTIVIVNRSGQEQNFAIEFQ